MWPGRRVTALVGAFATVLVAGGCAFSNIDLVQDHRLHFTAPAAYATVALPVTIRWTVTSDVRPGTKFAVFVDRTVIKPGASLRSVADGDRQCLSNPSCPTSRYLRAHDVYVVSSPELTLHFLSDLAGTQRGTSKDAHTVTVVILKDGHRDGENAFSRTFYVRRGSA